MPGSITTDTNIQQKLCLATVTNKEYWLGTKVMLRSFLRQNHWFDGDIIIVTLDRNFIQRKLNKTEFRARVLSPSEKLLNQIYATKEPVKGLKVDELLKIELFSLTEYDRVIYYDSDILHIGEFNRELLLKDGLVAAIDPWFFRGFLRNRVTLKKIRITDNPDNAYKNYINSGFMLIGNNFLNEQVYSQLIEAIIPELYRPIEDILADEPVFNRVFENDFTLAKIEANCPVHLISEGRIKEKVFSVHFTGIYKPWRVKSWMVLTMRNPAYLKYLVKWILYFLSEKLRI
jgi:lipopolysaccharide biosynthesis glycosyltransferase